MHAHTAERLWTAPFLHKPLRRAYSVRTSACILIWGGGGCMDALTGASSYQLKVVQWHPQALVPSIWLGVEDSCHECSASPRLTSHAISDCMLVKGQSIVAQLALDQQVLARECAVPLTVQATITLHLACTVCSWRPCLAGCQQHGRAGATWTCGMRGTGLCMLPSKLACTWTRT